MTASHNIFNLSQERKQKKFTTSLETTALKSNTSYSNVFQLFKYVIPYFTANDIQCWEHWEKSGIIKMSLFLAWTGFG